MDDPRIALAASPRGWAQALHRHVADHGGALVRATVLHQQDAVAEDYDVFIADDCTSFLTSRLVDALHQRGRAVLGVFDADDPRGKGDLLDMGVDAVIDREEQPAAFLAAITGLAARRAAWDDAGAEALSGTPDPEGGEGPSAPAGQLVAVTGAGGGTGATEVALGLAQAMGRRGSAVALVDADDTAPAVAQRLGLPLYPNLRAAVDALERGSRSLLDLLAPLTGTAVGVLPGASAVAGAELLAPATAEVLQQLRGLGRDVVVDVGGRVQPATGTERSALAGAVLGSAGCTVAVAQPTPVGLARLLDWFGAARLVLEPGAVHVAFNRAPSSGFKRQELSAELLRSVEPAGVWFLPGDGRVEAAAWSGRMAPPGPFTRAVGAMAAAIRPAEVGHRRWRWRR